MSDLAPLFNYLIDLACMMLPTSVVGRHDIPPDIFVLVGFAAIGVMVFLFCLMALRPAFPGGGFAAAVMAFCVVGLGIVRIGFETWKAIFSIEYVALVMALRSVEGMVVGGAIRRHKWLLLIPVAAIVAAVLYWAIGSLPPELLPAILGLWALFGAALSSFVVARKLSQKGVPVFGGLVGGVVLFVLLLATTLYISTSEMGRIIYGLSFPVGLVMGLIFLGRRGAEED